MVALSDFGLTGDAPPPSTPDVRSTRSLVDFWFSLRALLTALVTLAVMLAAVGTFDFRSSSPSLTALIWAGL
jgi:hypothetical protein